MDTWNYHNRAWQRADCLTFGGNGFWGGRVPLDGHGADGNPFAAAVAGFYVGEGEVMADVPHPLNAPLRLDGIAARPLWSDGFAQTLALREGCVRTLYPDDTGKVRVESEFFFHRARPHLALYRTIVVALRDVNIELSPQLNCAIGRLKPTTARVGEGSWVLDFGDSERTAAQVLQVKVVSDALYESQNLDLPHVLGRRIAATLRAGERLTVEVVVATAVKIEAEDDEPLSIARREGEDAARLDFEALKGEHEGAMQGLWDEFHIECADPFIERRARSALFYLLSGYRDDVVWGGSATGLSGNSAWGGCVFWDTEFYMFPALLLLFPTLAKNTLLYRVKTSAGARENLLEGEAGLRFAWESRRSGREFAGDFSEERHIGSDIAFCADWYARATGDEEFWKQHGRALLVGVARFWASRARHDAGRDSWHIPGVIPPDEHVFDHYRGAPVDDSVMTNAYAAWVLRQAVAQRDVAAEEAALWYDIAAKMHLPRDEARGLWLEYEGYDDHPIKQADVGHLFFPMGPWFVGASDEDVRRNITFYADRERETGLGILHSPFVYGAAMSRAGDVAGVRRFLDWSWHNVAGGYDAPRELLHSTGPTITSCGAFLGLLLYGVLGLENGGEQLSAHPCVPESVGELFVSGIKFRGHRYSLRARFNPDGPSHCDLRRLD